MPPFHMQTPTKSTVAFRTVGCRLNQCETAQMQEALAAAGFCLVGWDEPADIRVVNTCTVTARSDRTCRHEIRLAKRLDPHCFVVATGCYAQVAPGAVAAIPGVDLVLGNVDKLQLAERLPDRVAVAAPTPIATPVVAVSPYPDRPDFEGEFFTHFHGYTRAFLKIQTGCDSYCTYCVIPSARGPARSMAAPAVLEQIRLLAARNYREVVLTGIDLGAWGRDTGEGTLADLLTLILEDGAPAAGRGPGDIPAADRVADRAADRVDRYRLSSIEPLGVDDALLDVVERSGERVAHHFHLPLQSGSDSVLSRMRRPYSAAEYLEVATALARRFPDAALGADVIVGFPGETEHEFEDTVSLIERSPLTYLHVFAYSDRPGTPASNMRPKVRTETIHERSMRLRALGECKKASFRDRLTGTEQRVLVLKERSADGRLVGLTGNYMEVLVGDDEALTNTFARVRLDRSLPDGRWEVTLLRREEPCE
jgi:threonylcarbamoyladenosine tRNA methylthiotransferase MtaB